MNRYLEAQQIWDWIQFRLPPDEWFEAQRALHAGPAPTPSDPILAAGLAELLDPQTTRARRVQLLTQLLNFIRNGPVS